MEEPNYCSAIERVARSRRIVCYRPTTKRGREPDISIIDCRVRLIYLLGTWNLYFRWRERWMEAQ